LNRPKYLDRLDFSVLLNRARALDQQPPDLEQAIQELFAGVKDVIG
jgi:hypothetical protein